MQTDPWGHEKGTSVLHPPPDLLPHQSTVPSHRRPPRAVARALPVMRAATLGLVVSVLVLAGLGLVGAPASGPASGAAGPATAATPAVDVVLQRMMTARQCSTQGLAPSEIPASALVRTPAGRLRLVSFDRGWAVHEGRAAGTLVAVCRLLPD